MIISRIVAIKQRKKQVSKWMEEDIMSKDRFLFLCFIVSLKMANIKARAYAKESNPIVRRKLMLQERENNCRRKGLEILRKNDPNFLNDALSICLL